MSPTHEHLCYICANRYYCERRHRWMADDNQPHQGYAMHVRDGARCCETCRQRNISACLRFGAYSNVDAMLLMPDETARREAQ